MKYSIKSISSSDGLRAGVDGFDGYPGPFGEDKHPCPVCSKNCIEKVVVFSCEGIDWFPRYSVKSLVMCGLSSGIMVFGMVI